MKLTKAIIVTALALMGTMVCHAKANITGSITCQGKGVEGVSVSDGYNWDVTDAKGRYNLQSDKKNGYVFYVLPSGYEPTSENGFLPQFWAPLNTDVKKKEKHDFRLKKVNNDNFNLIVATDLHLANRNNDIAQCDDMFMSSVHRVASASQVPIYSLFLGDVTYDEFWYCDKFRLNNYIDMLARNHYPTLLYHAMGNHDNNPSIPASADCDFLSSGQFRTYLGPRYYSLNLGRTHIVVLDDIFYKNLPTDEPQNIGVVGDQSYDDMVTEEQLDWLAEDLARIEDRSAPVIVAMHSQCWKLTTDGNFTVLPYLLEDNCHQLNKAFKGFTNVKFVTGHSHYNYHAHPMQYPNIHENNIAAVCATWWFTKEYSPRHLCRDGSPAGYELYSVNGKDVKWRYTAIDPIDSIGNKQMRVYDMNTVSEFYRTSPEIKKLAEYYPTQIMYGNVPANQIMINVFDYDTDWKVEVIEDGTPLEVSRIVAPDPLHVLCSSVNIIKKDNRKPGICRSIVTNHMFTAQASKAQSNILVRVTDSFGRTYTEVLNRPKAFTEIMK